MGFIHRAAVAVAAALLFAAPVHAASSPDAVDTPPPPGAAPVPAYEQLGPQSSVLTPSLETAADIDLFLARTPLAGLGAEFVRAEVATGVNARVLVGITWTENNSGASFLARTQHNLFSFTGNGPGGFISYSSWEESIRTSAEYIGREYARPGGVHYRGGTIAAVGSVYAADPEWPVKVARSANFIGPSRSAAYAVTLRVTNATADHLDLHLSNLGYAPLDGVAGAQLLVHYRWARPGESASGVVAVPAPSVRSGGEADLVVPGIAPPDHGDWRLDVNAVLAGPGWVAELGAATRDSLRVSSQANPHGRDGVVVRDRRPLS